MPVNLRDYVLSLNQTSLLLFPGIVNTSSASDSGTEDSDALCYAVPITVKTGSSPLSRAQTKSSNASQGVSNQNTRDSASNASADIPCTKRREATMDEMLEFCLYQEDITVCFLLLNRDPGLSCGFSYWVSLRKH